MRRPSAGATLLGAALAIAAALLGACHHSGSAGEAGTARTEPAEALGPAPSYSSIAERYNQRVQRLDRFSARSNLNVTYFDENGEQKNEQPEGRLQVIRPDRLALSLGMAGQTLFWFGCDPEQYWWFDVSDNHRRIAAVGRHTEFGDSAVRRIGLAIRPLDLILVLAVTPLDPALPGATQWSSDGTLIGVTTPIGRRGYQRLWLDARSLTPRTVEIFDPQKQLVVVADHEGQEPVEQTRGGIGTPYLSERVTVSHIESGTDIRLTVSSARDGPISDKAFDLPTLLEKFSVARVIDLDKPPAPRAGAAAP